MVRVEDVIDHYKHVVSAHTKRVPYRPSISVPEDRATGEAFLRWAQQHDIDPNYWITDYVAFVHRTYRRCPPFRSLRSEKALPAYLARERAWREKRESKRNAASMRALDAQRVVDLSLCVRSQEDVRRRYLQVEQRPDACRMSMEYSGGYDPRSKYCPQCPQAIVCSRQMNDRYRFNVVALRTGAYEELPADIAALAKAHVRRLPVR